MIIAGLGDPISDRAIDGFIEVHRFQIEHRKAQCCRDKDNREENPAIGSFAMKTRQRHGALPKPAFEKASID
jgi:hypothetical protein